MATPRKLNVYFAFFSYGGNGGISSEVPDIREWFTQVLLKAKADERIDNIDAVTISDTPITMTRNKSVLMAREAGADVLVMVDSDMNPLLHKNDPDYKPFWDTSFDFLYEHYDKGPVVVGAPYCGPPTGHENMYVFRWNALTDTVRGLETGLQLDQYSRHEAARQRGIQECAALPTGLIMYDMRAFELTEPTQKTDGQILDAYRDGKMSKREALRGLSRGWFYYEWKNPYASEKGSTEDVTNTRDLSLAGCVKLGYNPMFCNWDSPAGHWKPWCVSGRPAEVSSHFIASNFQRICETEEGEQGEVEVQYESPMMKRVEQGFASVWDKHYADKENGDDG